MTQGVRDIMSRQLALGHVDHSLAEAAKRMREADVGALPVVDGDELVGVVMDRDLVVRATTRCANPTTARVSQAMTRHVVFCHESTSVGEAASLMARAGCASCRWLIAIASWSGSSAWPT
jgi:CBS domain-containing protein